MQPKTNMAFLGVAILVFAFILTPELVEAQAYSITFTVTGLPAGVRTQYYLDGVLNGTIAASETKTLQLSPGILHTIDVDPNLAGDSGIKYQCENNTWSFSGAGVHTFVYETQYYLEVASLYGSPSGSDWYDAGTIAQARLAANMTVGAEGVRYVFVKWEQDASGQGTTSDPILMDRPRKAVAQWKTQYNLRISYDPVGIFSPSTLWFDADSNADFIAPEGTNGTDARQVFVQWSGDYSGANVRGSMHMDGPKSVIAKYKAQYRLSVSFDPPEIAQKVTLSNGTWYDAGQAATLGPVPQIIPGSSVQRFAWFSWNVDGMTQPGTSIGIVMDRAHSVRLTYQTQYYLLVMSALGEPTGTGWYVSGQKAKFGVAYSGSDLLVKHSLAGWRLNSSDVINTLPPTMTEVTMDRPYVIEAEWNTDYTPLWVFILVLVSAAIVFAAVIVIVVKRPGSLGRLHSSLRSGLGRRKIAVPGIELGRASAISDLEKLDDQVYDYVVRRHGEISLSQASKDLGVSVQEVKLSTERLKKKGRLA